MTTGVARSKAACVFRSKLPRAVRAVVPRGIPFGARLTGSDWLDGGLTVADAVALAKALKDAGLDYVDVSSGGVSTQGQASVPRDPGYNVPLAEQIRREAGIATRVVGLIANPKQAEAIVASGQADMVALARAFLDDPHWGWHAAQALGGEIYSPAAIPARRGCGLARSDVAYVNASLGVTPR